MYAKLLDQHVRIDGVEDYASLLDHYVQKLEGYLKNVHRVTLDPPKIKGITVKRDLDLMILASLDSRYEDFTEGGERSFVGLSMSLEREGPVNFEINVLGSFDHDEEYYGFYRHGKLLNSEQKLSTERIDDYLRRKMAEEFPILMDLSHASINTYNDDCSYGPLLQWVLPTGLKEPLVLPWQKIYHRAIELTRTMPEIFARGEGL